MPSSKPRQRASTRIPRPRYPADPLQVMFMFLSGKDPAHVSLRRLLRRLNRAGISYAVMGGLAVEAHGHQRMTVDVDVLLTSEGLEEFRRRFVPKYYASVARRTRRFRDRANGVTIDILVTGLFPGSGRPGPISFPDPEDVRQRIRKVPYLNLISLIQLKLAARRYQDFADVVGLINAHELDEAFAAKLHPSVRGDYIECLEEKRREDEYLARNG